MSGENMRYTFDRHLAFAAAFVVASLVPTSMVIEILSQGYIDTSAVSPTRREIPMWILYSGGSLIWLFTLWWLFVPVARYIWRGEIFSIAGDQIVIQGTAIHKNDILSHRETFRGMRVETKLGAFLFHPRLSSKGLAAFEDFLAIRDT